MDWAQKITDNVKGAGSVVDAFRDALDPDRKDVAETKAAEKWNWRPIAIALGGVVVVAIVLRMVFKK